MTQMHEVIEQDEGEAVMCTLPSPMNTTPFIICRQAPVITRSEIVPLETRIGINTLETRVGINTLEARIV